MAGQHDDRHVGNRKYAGRAHDAHQLGAVEQRHLPVEDHHVGAMILLHLDAGRAVVGGDDAEALRRQLELDEAKHPGLVVDSQHERLH